MLKLFNSIQFKFVFSLGLLVNLSTILPLHADPSNDLATVVTNLNLVLDLSKSTATVPLLNSQDHVIDGLILRLEGHLAHKPTIEPDLFRELNPKLMVLLRKEFNLNRTLTLGRILILTLPTTNPLYEEVVQTLLINLLFAHKIETQGRRVFAESLSSESSIVLNIVDTLRIKPRVGEKLSSAIKNWTVAYLHYQNLNITDYIDAKSEEIQAQKNLATALVNLKNELLTYFCNTQNQIFSLSNFLPDTRITFSIWNHTVTLQRVLQLAHFTHVTEDQIVQIFPNLEEYLKYLSSSIVEINSNDIYLNNQNGLVKTLVEVLMLLIEQLEFYSENSPIHKNLTALVATYSTFLAQFPDYENYLIHIQQILAHPLFLKSIAGKSNQVMQNHLLWNYVQLHVGSPPSTRRPDVIQILSLYQTPQSIRLGTLLTRYKKYPSDLVLKTLILFKIIHPEKDDLYLFPNWIDQRYYSADKKKEFILLKALSTITLEFLYPPSQSSVELQRISLALEAVRKYLLYLDPEIRYKLFQLAKRFPSTEPTNNIPVETHSVTSVASEVWTILVQIIYNPPHNFIIDDKPILKVTTLDADALKILFNMKLNFKFFQVLLSQISQLKFVPLDLQEKILTELNSVAENEFGIYSLHIEAVIHLLKNLPIDSSLFPQIRSLPTSVQTKIFQLTPTLWFRVETNSQSPVPTINEVTTYLNNNQDNANALINIVKLLLEKFQLDSSNLQSNQKAALRDASKTLVLNFLKRPPARNIRDLENISLVITFVEQMEFNDPNFITLLTQWAQNSVIPRLHYWRWLFTIGQDFGYLLAREEILQIRVQAINTLASIGSRNLIDNTNTFRVLLVFLQGKNSALREAALDALKILESNGGQLTAATTNASTNGEPLPPNALRLFRELSKINCHTVLSDR